jgi:hypothetical protein
VEARVFRRREAIDPLLEERRRDVRSSCLGDMDGNLSGGGAQVPVTVRRRHLQLEEAWERKKTSFSPRHKNQYFGTATKRSIT